MNRNSKRNMPKKRRKFPVILVIVLLLVVVAGGVFATTMMNKSKPTATGVEKTNKANGYDENTRKVVKSTNDVIANTGEPQWVQVKSKGSGEKFTDLSSGSFFIYKVHNPQVLKTAVSIEAPTTLISDVVAKYPNTLIMNASGFDFGSKVITGFQINNGQLFKDWGTDGAAYNAFVINKDGSSKVYDSSTPASKIIADGAAMSFSFGSILIKNGKVQPNDGTVNWMIHSFIGNDADNNIYVIISDTSTGYENIMAKFQELGLKNAVVMDGGGSSQMSFKGQTIYPSQDERSVNDFIVLK